MLICIHLSITHVLKDLLRKLHVFFFFSNIVLSPPSHHCEIHIFDIFHMTKVALATTFYFILQNRSQVLWQHVQKKCTKKFIFSKIFVRIKCKSSLSVAALHNEHELNENILLDFLHFFFLKYFCENEIGNSGDFV